jgi:hypothetical protein
MAGRKLTYISKDGFSPGHVPIHEIVIETIPIERSGKSGIRHECLKFGGKKKPPRDVVVEERFFTGSVSGKEEGSFIPVVKAEGEHTDEAGKAVFSPGTVGFDENFCIALSAECMPFILQLLTEFQEIVYFTVEDDDKLSRRLGHGLMATGGQINDRQSPLSKP